MDFRRDREEGQEHGGAGMVGRNGQGGRSGDEWDGVVVPSMGGTRARSIGGRSGRFDGFVDVLTAAYVSRDVRMNEAGMNRGGSVPQGRAVLCWIDRVASVRLGLWVGCPTEA